MVTFREFFIENIKILPYIDIYLISLLHVQILALVKKGASAFHVCKVE